MPFIQMELIFICCCCCCCCLTVVYNCSLHSALLHYYCLISLICRGKTMDVNMCLRLCVNLSHPLYFRICCCIPCCIVHVPTVSAQSCKLGVHCLLLKPWSKHAKEFELDRCSQSLQIAFLSALSKPSFSTWTPQEPGMCKSYNVDLISRGFWLPCWKLEPI